MHQCNSQNQLDSWQTAMGLSRWCSPRGFGFHRCSELRILDERGTGCYRYARNTLPKESRAARYVGSTYLHNSISMLFVSSNVFVSRYLGLCAFSFILIVGCNQSFLGLSCRCNATQDKLKRTSDVILFNFESLSTLFQLIDAIALESADVCT